MQHRLSETNAIFILPGAGELNKRVLLRQRIDQPTSDYGVASEYQNMRTVWAKVRQVGATTLHESVQTDNKITHYITIRYRRDITADFEVVLAGIVYRIKRGRDLNSAGRYLLLECEELGAEDRRGDMYGQTITPC